MSDRNASPFDDDGTKWANRLADEKKQPNICIRHPLACYYDGPTCPACQAEKEFLALTKHME